MTIAAPEPLAAHHAIEAFDSGVDSLDQCLKHRALRNQRTAASRTFVACENCRVAADYPKNGSWQPVVTEKAKHLQCFGTDSATLGLSPIG